MHARDMVSNISLSSRRIRGFRVFLFLVRELLNEADNQQDLIVHTSQLQPINDIRLSVLHSRPHSPFRFS